MPSTLRGRSSHAAARSSVDHGLRGRGARARGALLALVLLAGTLAAVGGHEPASARGDDLIVGWMFPDRDELGDGVRDCRSLVSFRPDGSELTKVVDCNDNDLGITSVQNLAVSPDGDRIAFTGRTTMPTTRSALFVVGIDGSGLEELCITGLNCDAPSSDPFNASNIQVSWGSDGLLYASLGVSRVLVLAFEDGIVADIDWSATGNPDARGIRLSPDGSTVLFHDWDNIYLASAADILAYDDDSFAYERLTPCRWPCHAVWHPSGEGVLYSVNLQDPTDFETQSIAYATADPDSPNPVEYVRQTGFNPQRGYNPWLHSPSASPDGTRLVVGSWLDGGIYVVETSDSQYIDLGDLTPLFTPYYGQSGGSSFVSAGGFQWVVPMVRRIEPPAPSSTVAVSCAPAALQVGALVTCTVTGGDPGIDILWRASYNPTIAEAGVTLDADGTGSFTFTVPAEARGQEITVELVEWTHPVTLGVAGGPVPSSIPAGEGPGGSPTGLLALTGLLLVAGISARRRGALTAG